ncbi:arabinose efflux permease family protein [Saccharomonospora marina XMU15]|uniref:Arabinose efflux permease family protein n=1 Tax=Saccharomonospora marina XMU15 TaxID=882083 RepID=H5X8L4_9PSEU|nr:MFS transporter [Saccharomonospora marina]EHR51383.1 arabinose efflux permease family protein [Saccharomonospora marina XMU15]
MKTLASRFATFDRPSKLLMINQFGINVGFYMLMPYLAGYLAGPLGLATWAIGLVLGVRNFSQQGMFLLGGTLADRFGCKPLIVAGCLLRTGGFALLAVADTLPALVVASAATGFAGALFNPAVRAYLAADAGERRVEAFALFNTFYQGGILLGPLFGLALTALDFRVTCLVGAVVFAALTVLQLRSLPRQDVAASTARGSVLSQWRTVLGNRPFLLFGLAMIGSYVLSFQVYLALPLQVRAVAGSGTVGTALVTSLFVVSGAVAVFGQLRVTQWFGRRYGPARSIVAGMALLSGAFVPLLLVPDGDVLGPVPAVAAVLLSAALLALGTVAVFPFEMDTIVRLSGERLVATHYGCYNTVVGVGIMLGNLFTGTIFDLTRQAGVPQLVWAGLILIGAGCVLALAGLERSWKLAAAPDANPAATN